MQIDFFTLGAQLVNFIILVYLLKRFLFGRIISAMDNRQNLINSRLEEADRKKREAEGESESLRNRQREIEEERGKILDQARSEAEDQRRDMLNRARGEVDAEQARWGEAVRGSRDTFFQELREHIGKEALRTARTALRDLSGDDLEYRIAESFAGRIRNLGEDQRNELRQSLERSGNEVVIRSAGDLTEEVRGLITGAVRETLAPDLSLRFEQAPEIIGGIEMRVNGNKISWSIGSYLDDLEERIGKVYDRGAGVKGEEATDEGKGEELAQPAGAPS